MSERRRTPRARASHPISYRRVDRPETPGEVRCLSLDVSDGGLAFETHAELAVGETLALEILAEAGKPPLHAVATVAWCRPRSERFAVGVEFLWIGSPIPWSGPPMMSPV